MARVSIEEYKKMCEEHMSKHMDYLEAIAAVNSEENEVIRTLADDNYDVYEKKFPELVVKYEKAREELKEKHGKYSSMYTCEAYCVVTTPEEIEQIIPKNEKNYTYCCQHLKDWLGKFVEAEYDSSKYGICEGLLFTLDEIYYLVVDTRTKKEYWVLDHLKESKEEYHLPYKMVENGKDYL